MTQPSLSACYRTLEERWTAYQQQLQFLTRQADFLMDRLDHTLLEQVTGLLQNPIPPANSILTPDEHLMSLEGWVSYLLRQHHANRVLMRSYLQEQQASLYDVLQSDCEPSLAHLRAALLLTPRLGLSADLHP